MQTLSLGLLMKIATVFRWTARCLGAALTWLFIVLFVGEGPPPLFAFSRDALMSWLLLVMAFSFVAARRYEFWGGLIGLAAIAGFCLTDYVASGFQYYPRGWLFPLFVLTPILFLVASLLRRMATRARVEGR